MSHSDITLYTHPMSRGRAVRWMLEECGAEYQTVLLQYGSEMKAPEYLTINPMGKVPALTHGNRTITETAAICSYLAEVFPEKNLIPKNDLNALAMYYRWLFFAAGPLEAGIEAKRWGNDLLPEDAYKTGYGCLDNLKTMIALALDQASPYLCGKQFTVADIQFSGLLNWALAMKLLDHEPTYQAYLDEVLSRPAYKKASAIDNSLMADYPMMT